MLPPSVNRRSVGGSGDLINHHLQAQLLDNFESALVILFSGAIVGDRILSEANCSLGNGSHNWNLAFAAHDPDQKLEVRSVE